MLQSPSKSVVKITNLGCSRQIRPPIYSLKQSKLRKRRVVRFAMLYFFLFIIFLCLIVGPVVASRFIKNLPSIPMDLLQPTGLNNNDTSNAATGTALVPGLGGAETGSGAAATSSF